MVYTERNYLSQDITQDGGSTQPIYYHFKEDTNSDENFAKVVCPQMGYKQALITGYINTSNNYSDKRLSQVECVGAEANISDCTYTNSETKVKVGCEPGDYFTQQASQPGIRMDSIDNESKLT
jgi:hypothetical protein